jgi:hypothetical protein
MAPLMSYCIEQLGPDRCMFESNFPFDKVSFSHHVLFNAFKRVAKGYSAAERAALFHDTAARAYRISQAQRHFARCGPPAARLTDARPTGGLLGEVGPAQLILDKGGEGGRFRAGAAARREYRPQDQRRQRPRRQRQALG